MKTNVIATSFILALIMLVIYLTVALCITRPNKTDNWKGCKIGNQCTTKDGWKVLIIQEAKK
jgi:hypothetical protein